MADYPVKDKEYYEHTLERVTPLTAGGWEIRFDDGCCFFCPAASPVEPKPGMLARLYGGGLGYRVRGLFLNGHCVFYRTPAADDRYCDEQLYGRDAADLLERWDAGRIVYTINVGGLGPGYDQAIQIVMFEVLRWLLQHKPDLSRRNAWASKVRDQLEMDLLNGHRRIKELGISGAQWGAACQLARQFYVLGPIKVLKGAEHAIQTANNIRFVKRCD